MDGAAIRDKAESPVLLTSRVFAALTDGHQARWRDAPEAPLGRPPMSQKNVQAARSLYEAFAHGDFDTLEKGVSIDVLWNEAENSLYSKGSPYRSFSEIRAKVFTPNGRDFDNFRLDIDRILDASDDHVVAAGRYRGRYKETGRELSSQFCHVMHFDKFGKVDFFQEFADTYDQAQVTGRVKPFEKMEIRQPIHA